MTYNGKPLVYYPVTTSFSPADIDSLVLWLKADAGVTLNGSTVSTWADQSGNGNDAVQSTASYQPLFVANQLNGKPVLRFDGSNDFMSFNEISNIRTAFVVVKHRTGSQDISPLFGHSTKYELICGINGNLYYDGISSIYVLNGHTFINGCNTPTRRIFQETSYILYSIETTGNVSAEYITNDRNIPNRYWDGDYVEIIIYSSELSDIDRIKVQKYIQDKYSITQYDYSSAIPIMISNTTPSGVVTYSSRYSETYDGFRAFDSEIETSKRWVTDGSSLPQWLQYQFGISKNIKAYSIKPIPYAGNILEAPKSFKLQASNDGVLWTDIDSQTNQTGWVANEQRFYEVAPHLNYTHYRIYITETNGSTYATLTNFEMFE